MSDLSAKIPVSQTMHGRGGFPFRTVIYAVVILTLVYVFYIYHVSQNNLHEAEMVGARYKREAEERVVEIQDLMRVKDRNQESCQNEKSELHNRIKSQNQQYSMLQSQYKETEADFIKLRQDMETLRSEHAQADTAHAAEYEKLKQEKENDIAKLKDEVADLTRENSNFENLVASLKQKMKENENAYKQLQDQNIQLQQQLQNRQQSHQLQQQNHGVLTPQHIAAVQSQAERESHPLQFEPDTHNKLDQSHDTGTADTQNKDVGVKNVVDDSFNAQHQVLPPHNNNIVVGSDNDDDAGKKESNAVINRPEVNPNDEQKAQILEPILEPNDKHQGGGEAGVVNMNARKEEEQREKDVKEEETENLHKDPLALGQIQIPGDLNDLHRQAGQVGKDDQQVPPLLNDENEQKEQDRGDNHYFGEEEEARQQQQHEEERQRMEEEERDEGNEGDFERNVDRFRDALGNQENKEAALEDADAN